MLSLLCVTDVFEEQLEVRLFKIQLNPTVLTLLAAAMQSCPSYPFISLRTAPLS